MGILRLYLALCVVEAHSQPFLPWPAHRAPDAVQIFFLVSGFYMALIASKYDSAREFYFSRFLRIFVPYWVVAGGVLLIGVILGVTVGYWGRLLPFVAYAPTTNGLLGVVLTGVTNLTLFGQDLVMFLKHDPGGALAFTKYYWTSPAPLWSYLLVPQAWSVGIEILFYLTVPWLNRLSTRRLGVVVGVSLLLRVGGYELLGLKQDPWTYRFFPFEMVAFGVGMLSCRGYQRWKSTLDGFFARRASGGFFGSALLCVVLLGGFFVTGRSVAALSSWIGPLYAPLIGTLSWGLLVPALFSVTKGLHWDRAVGELCYPVYLVHVSIAAMVGEAFRRYQIPPSYIGWITAAASIMVSVAIVWGVVIPLDRKRYVLAKRLAVGTTEPAAVPSQG